MEVLEVSEVIRCMLLCMLEAVEGWLLAGGATVCAILYAGGCGRYALFMEVLEASEALEVIRCMLRCMLEAVEGTFCLLEVSQVPEVIRRVLLCMLEAVASSVIWKSGS